MRYIIIILVIFIGFAAKAQYPSQQTPTQFSTGWFKQGWPQADSGNILAVRAPNFTPRFPGTIIMYRNPSGDTTVQYWTGNRWVGISSSGTITANNGLTLTAGLIQQGGPLVQNTDIPNGGFDFFIHGTGQHVFRTTNGTFQSNIATSPIAAQLTANNSGTDLFSEVNAAEGLVTLNAGSNGTFYNNISIAQTGIDLVTRANTSPHIFRYDFNGKLIIDSYGGSTYQTIDTSYNALVVDASGNVFKRAGTNGSGGAGLTSVALSMPSAFTVTNSPLTSNGTIAVSGAGTALQYIRGNGTLATTDTGMIPSFHLKVRSLFTGTSPITFNQTTGAIGINNANATGTKGAASFTGAFSDNGSGLIDLLNVVTAGSCTNCSVTFDAKGRATFFSTGTGPTGVSVDTLFRTPGIDSIYFTINGTQYAIKDSAGSAGGTVTNVSGTTNRITVTNPTTTPVIDIAATYVGQTSITTLGTIATGVWNGTAIGATFGGTGQTSVTTGDLLYGSATNTWSKLAGVATGNALISGGVTTAPSWGKIGLTTHVSGILPVANGGTGTATPSLVAGTDISITGTWPNQTINATGSGTPSLTATQIAFGSPGNAMTSEAALNYISADNKLNADSIDLIQGRADSFFYRVLSPYPKPDTAYLIGDSHTVGIGATTQDSGYAYREAFGLDVVPVSVAVSGTGAVSIANRFLIAKNPGNTTAAIVMDGFNDPRRNALPRNTLNKIINSHKSIFANQYMKSFTNAGTGGVGVTRSGSWVNSWPADAEGGKVTVGAYTSSTNDSIRYAFTDSTVLVGLMGGDGSSASYIGTDIDVRIDALPISFTWNTNNQTDGVADGSGLDNKRCAMSFVVTGLTNAAHTITLIKKSTGGGGFMICDYFGHLVDKSTAQLMLWHHIPRMDSTGYTLSPALATNATTDTINAKIDSLKSTYPISIFPTLVVATNTAYNPVTDGNVDSVHMANPGHRKVANLALDVTIPGVVPMPTANGAVFYTNEFKGIVNDENLTFLMREKADERYIRNQSYFTQIADYNINGIATADKVVSSGSIFGSSLTVADRQIHGIVGGTASGGPFFEIRNNFGATDAKSYGFFVGSNAIMHRLLSDDLSLETRYYEVVRTGMTIDTIRMPKLDITTGPLKVYAHALAANSDSAVVWNRTTKAYEYAKINGSGGSQTWQQTLTTGSTLTGANTVTGGNNSFTFNGMFNYRINANSFILDKTTATAPYSFTVLGADNRFQLAYTPTAATYSKGVGIVIDTNNNASIGSQIPTTAPLYAIGNSAFVNGIQSQSGNFFKVDPTTSDVTAGLDDYYFRIDATSGNITITLPAASAAFGASMGIRYVFKRIDASINTVTVARAGSDTIDGATTISLVTQYSKTVLQCSSASTWDVLP